MRCGVLDGRCAGFHLLYEQARLPQTDFALQLFVASLGDSKLQHLHAVRVVVD